MRLPIHFLAGEDSDRPTTAENFLRLCSRRSFSLRNISIHSRRGRVQKGRGVYVLLAENRTCTSRRHLPNPPCGIACVSPKCYCFHRATVWWQYTIRRGYLQRQSTRNVWWGGDFGGIKQPRKQRQQPTNKPTITSHVTNGTRCAICPFLFFWHIINGHYHSSRKVRRDYRCCLCACEVLQIAPNENPRVF